MCIDSDPRRSDGQFDEVPPVSVPAQEKIHQRPHREPKPGITVVFIGYKIVNLF